MPELFKYGVSLDMSASGGMTDEEFYHFCRANDHLRIERDAKGEIWIMSPTGGFTGLRNNEISRQLGNWNYEYKLGYVFDSSTGYKLANNADRSPDVSWIKKEIFESLSQKEKERFLPIAPNFIIELKSKSDSLKQLKLKMEEWIENGCQLGWLIDPYDEKVYVYNHEGLTSIHEGFDIPIKANDLLPSFELVLAELR